MSDCHQAKVRAARQRVVDELARFRLDDSDERLTALKAAINEWHDKVGAWSQANTIGPSNQNLS